LGIEILRTMLVEPHLSAAIYHGRLYQGEECLAAGWVHELAEAEHVEARALDLARELAQVPSRSFALTKGLLRLPALDALDKHGTRTRAESQAVWADPQTLAAVETYISKTLKKS
jgi:enoyl-CoA hydratase/carnithine racemase